MSSYANGSGGSNAELAALLRNAAELVEKNETGAPIHLAWGALGKYMKEHGGSKKVTTTTTRVPAPGRVSPTTETRHSSPEKENVFSAEQSAGFDKPFDESPASRPESNDKKAKDAFNIGNFSKRIPKSWLHPPKPTDADKRSTSTKNAERARAEVEEHRREQRPTSPEAAASRTPAGQDSGIQNVNSNSSSVASGLSTGRSKQPAFHRPNRPDSNLIANGWIEQQRRSRMRSTWKQVLASLVEGRNPREETTLWIQRKVMNAQGKPELQALHQVPMKWLESVNYMEFYADNRFSIKVYNVADEFLFRCGDKESAQNWVSTLRSISEVVQKKRGGGEDANIKDLGLQNMDDWEGGSTKSGFTESSTTQRISVKELQAIAHGAGYNTSGMERAELERLVTGISLGGSDPRKEAMVEEQRRRQQQQQHLKSEEAKTSSHDKKEASQQPRRTIAELQSIAHGAGHNTSGMERSELERLVAKVLADEANLQQQKDAVLEAQRRRQQEEEARRQRELAEAEQRRREQEEEQRRLAEEESRRRREEEEQRHVDEVRRQIEEEERQRLLAEQRAAEQRRQEEERQRRIAEQRAAEQRRLQAEEEERQRRLAEQRAAEQRRQQEEQQRQWAQRQAEAERLQREDDEKRKAAEARKRQEWERAQWQQQQAADAAKKRAEWERNWHQQQQRQQTQNQYPQQGFPGQQQQQSPFNASQGYRPAPGGYQPPPASQAGYQPPPQPPKPPHPHPASPADMKYAKMADQKEDGQAAITNIKKNILIHWALQPPMLQMLRPIDMLLTTIHTVFPPAFGVQGHDYFSKWTPVSRESITVSNTPDDAKLKKAVRKLRFFLHPDKLPRDLNEEQSFMVKMLWDVTSDAWEEFHKKNEELGWIHN